MANRTTSLSPAEARRWTRVGTLAALSLLLGYVESFIPIPIPGVKLGLANIPILVALEQGDLSGAFFVGMVKVVATSVLFGNPVTLAYALTGTLLAYALMAPLSRLRTMRLEMVSVVGALAHETGQLLVAQVLLGTPLVWYSAPVLAVAGIITGLLCGIVARRTAALLDGQPDKPSEIQVASAGRTPSAPTAGTPMPPVAPLALGYAALVLAALHAHTVPLAAACLVAAGIATLAARVPLRTLRSALAPTLPLALVTLIAQIVSTQHGLVLATLGPLVLTREALMASLLMVLRLASITLASVALVALIGQEGLMRCTERTMAPLSALGMRTEGPQLALATTMQLIPALSATFGTDIQPRDVWTRAFWAERLPQLVRRLYAQAAQRPMNDPTQA